MCRLNIAIRIILKNIPEGKKGPIHFAYGSREGFVIRWTELRCGGLFNFYIDGVMKEVNSRVKDR